MNLNKLFLTLITKKGLRKTFWTNGYKKAIRIQKHNALATKKTETKNDLQMFPIVLMCNCPLLTNIDRGRFERPRNLI